MSSLFNAFQKFWSDEENEGPIITNIKFIKNGVISGKFEICGVTPRYILINGEYVERERFIFLKQDEEVTIIRESDIIKSSVDVKPLVWKDFHENIWTNQKYRVD
jgi:hypothetical protein